MEAIYTVNDKLGGERGGGGEEGGGEEEEEGRKISKSHSCLLLQRLYFFH